MKRIQSYIFLACIALFVSSCTPKVGSDMQSSQTEANQPESDNWRSSAPMPAPAPAFNLGEYESFKLGNGLDVIVVENHKLPVVSYQLFVDRGPLKEGNIAGISSIAGQMLRTGTDKMTKEEIDEKLDFIAATLSTSSSGFFASSLKKHSNELLDIATDILYHPSFPQSEFDRLIQTTKSGLAFQKSDPNSISANVGNAILYGKEHAYGEFTTEESVDAITLDDVHKFYKDNYFPNNTYLIIVGDITTAEAKSQAESHFGDWKQKNNFSPMIPASVNRPAQNAVSFINKDGAVQSVVTVAQTNDYKPDAEDRMAASVMNTILGGYFGSRLNKNIREDKGYTYGIRSSLSSDRYIGDFSISASVRNEVTDSTLTEIFNELNGLRNNPVPEKELELVKNVKTGQFARGLESPQTVAQYALNIARYNLPKDYYETYLARLEKITPEDIQKAAQKYLDPDKMDIIIVGNESTVTDKLLPFDKNNEIDFYDAKANKLDKALDEANMEGELDEVDAEAVIEKYIQAVGGRDNLTAVKSFFMKSEASTPMGDVTTTIQGKDNTKVNMKVEASGMVVQEITFNGLKAEVGGVQGSQVITDPKQFDRFRDMAQFAEELDYFTSDNYKITYAGQEKLDGEPAYKIQVMKSDGTTTTEFYSVETGLKMKEVMNIEANGQQITTTQKLADYQEVDGIKVPMETTLSGGGMPFEMVTKVAEIKINPEISDDVFEIN